LEEWYKHSTQPSTIPQNPVFHSNLHLFTLTVALFSSSAHLHSLALSLHYSRFYLYNKEESWQQPMCSLINANQLLQEESHGGWKKVDKFANVDNLLHIGHVLITGGQLR
jgi:hypothetical protein